MCATCGCGPTSHQHHDDSHDHHHASHQNNGKKNIIDVEQDILLENNLLAQRNRGYF